QGGEGYGRKAPVVGPDQHGSDQQHFQQDRDDRVQRPVEQIGYGTAAPFDIPRHAAGAPPEVEFQTEPVQVAEHPERDLARGARHDPGEHHLAQFGEQGDSDACRAVGQQESDRQQQQTGFDIEVVDNLLEKNGNQQVEQFGGHHQAQCQRDAPQVGTQV